jgi:hypothetical protein
VQDASHISEDVKARHDKMVEFMQRAMSDIRGTMSAGRKGERLTACSLRPTADARPERGLPS